VAPSGPHGSAVFRSPDTHRIAGNFKPPFVLKDSVPDLENAERLATFYKERVGWVRNQIHVSLETILVANGASREEARAEA
jgi:hypothetical protein